MKPRTATFAVSASEPTGFPPPTLPEIAIAGRSNVGKSSLINALCSVSGLARTSRTPGRTRLVNWFHIDASNMPGAVGRLGQLHLIDLPGYGYAEVPMAMRASWQPLIEAVLAQRPTLRAVVLLVDIRREIDSEEIDFAAWLADRKLPLVVALTKADKLGKAQRPPVAAAAKRALGLRRDPIVCSSQDDFGRDELWRAIAAAALPPLP